MGVVFGHSKRLHPLGFLRKSFKALEQRHPIMRHLAPITLVLLSAAVSQISSYSSGAPSCNIKPGHGSQSGSVRVSVTSLGSKRWQVSWPRVPGEGCPLCDTLQLGPEVWAQVRVRVGGGAAAQLQRIPRLLPGAVRPARVLDKTILCDY